MKVKEHTIYLAFSPKAFLLGSRRRRGGPEEFRGGSLTFCLPKQGGSA